MSKKIYQGTTVGIRHENGQAVQTDEVTRGKVERLRLGGLSLSSANRVGGLEVYVNGQWISADECEFTGVGL